MVEAVAVRIVAVDEAFQLVFCFSVFFWVGRCRFGVHVFCQQIEHLLDIAFALQTSGMLWCTTDCRLRRHKASHSEGPACSFDSMIWSTRPSPSRSASSSLSIWSVRESRLSTFWVCCACSAASCVTLSCTHSSLRTFRTLMATFMHQSITKQLVASQRNRGCRLNFTRSLLECLRLELDERVVQNGKKHVEQNPRREDHEG